MTRALLLGVIAFALGCGDSIPATFVMVTVDAEPGVRANATRLQVVVSGSSASTDEPVYAERLNRSYTRAANDLVWPRSLALEPANHDASRLFELVATAFDSTGAQIGQVRVLSGYVPKEQRAIRLVLEDSCTNRACTATETCRANTCIDANIDPNALEAFDPKPTTDGGRDAEFDAAIRDGSNDATFFGDASDDAAVPVIDSGLDAAEATADTGVDAAHDSAVLGPFGTQCQPCQTDDDCINGVCSSPFNGVCRTYCTHREDPACDIAAGLLCANSVGTCGVNVNHFPGGCAEWLNR